MVSVIPHLGLTHAIVNFIPTPTQTHLYGTQPLANLFEYMDPLTAAPRSFSDIILVLCRITHCLIWCSRSQYLPRS